MILTGAAEDIAGNAAAAHLAALELGGPRNQYISVWHPADLSFEVVDDLTSDPVVTIIVHTPDGRLSMMAEPEMIATMLVLHRVHLQDAWANAVGAANLMRLAHTVMERMDIDGLVLEGALRTTGANPGRRPRVLRFTRRVRSAAERNQRGDPDG